MAEILNGIEVANALNQRITEKVKTAKNQGVSPALSIVRVGERPDDMYYEAAATKRCESLGILAEHVLLPESATTEVLLETLKRLNADPLVHGVLLLKPFPKHIDSQAVRFCLLPEKDVDGITDGSIAGVFTGEKSGFPPCTAQACMEVLDYYKIPLKGSSVTVIGRSLVVGKPLAMLLLQKNATVTVCHTSTIDMPKLCQQADILIAAAGKAKMVDESYVSPGQTVIDVGINEDEQGKLCGDVNFPPVSAIVKAITPVPKGIGSVTTAVLADHVAEAACRSLIRKR